MRPPFIAPCHAGAGERIASIGGRPVIGELPVPAINEGKACDAVIRRIEAREGCPRSGFSLPERELHQAPVEAACRIGDKLFAFEHTRIEPFDGHIQLRVDALAHFKPIEERLAAILPDAESLHLLVPARATQSLKKRQIEPMQQALGDWIIQTRPTLPLVPYGDYRSPVQRVRAPGVPFAVSLYRFNSVVPGGQLFVRPLFEGNLAEERIARIRRAYDKKREQLAPWQRAGARGVLILEEDDINFTNPLVVAEALDQIEQGSTDRPHEIYLLSSAVKTPWWLFAIRVDDQVYDDFSVWGDSLLEIDPATLSNVTGR